MTGSRCRKWQKYKKVDGLNVNTTMVSLSQSLFGLCKHNFRDIAILLGFCTPYMISNSKT